MERYARDITSGSYAPTFFTIRIPNDENYENLLLDERMSPQAEAYFLHEYIHFLQDLTTIPGLSNICVVVDYMKWATHQAKNGKIYVPCLPKAADGYNLLNNQTMNSARLGYGLLDKIKVKEIRNLVLNDDKVQVNGVYHTRLNAIVTFKDSEGNNHQYQIGEFALSESMAYTIEQMLYPNVLPDAPDCPYRIVELICDKFLQGFSDDLCKIVALCDACLMYSFPGRIFQMAIEKLKTVDYKSLTAEQVFDFITQDATLQATEHNQTVGITMNDHLAKFSLHAAEQLSGYFTTSNYDSEKLFTILMLYTAMEIRKQRQHFFLEIARGGMLRDNTPLRSVMGELGCPVILNKTNTLTTILGRISFMLSCKTMYDPSCFWVFNQMYKILKQGCLNNDTYRCEMIDWCRDCFIKKGVKDLTSEGDECIYSPWKRVSDEEFQLCTFGRFWRTIKLAGVEPVNQ